MFRLIFRAHVACALWLPGLDLHRFYYYADIFILSISEVRFGDIETREPIMHTNDVSPSKWQAKFVKFFSPFPVDRLIFSGVLFVLQARGRALNALI
jgi:hypothetical protein